MALTTRRLKQIIYGLGTLAVLVGVVAGISVLRRPSTPSAPTPTPTASFVAITLEDVSLIAHGTPKLGEAHIFDVVARLRNPNPRAGVANYPITLTFINAQGQTIRSDTLSTYILPGGISYAVKIGVALGAPATRVDVELPSSPVFTVVPTQISLPRFSATLLPRTTKTVGETVLEEQKGLVTNLSALDWQFVEVTVVAVGSNSRPIGVGQTFVGELRTGEQREFTVQWPAAAEAVARVIILPSTNLYQQENVVRAIGDPGLLR